MKKKKKKYALGSGFNGIVNNYLETPYDAMIEDELAMAKADSAAANDPLAKGLGITGSLVQQFGGDILGAMMALGGTIKKGGVEVEGGEVFETPSGKTGEIQGASHEQGGVDGNFLPPGTDIYSERVLGPDGKTTADRKKAREKKETKLQKQLDKNPSDSMLQKTLQRVRKDHAKEEQADKQRMEMAKKMDSFLGGTSQKFALGGTVNPPPDYMNSDFNYSFFKDLQKQGNFDKYDFDTDKGRKIFQSDLGVSTDGKFGKNTMSAMAEKFKIKTLQGEKLPLKKYESSKELSKIMPLGISTDTPTSGKENKSFLDKFSAGLSTGDMAGLFGNLYSMTEPMKNTKAMRAGDTPNINAYKDFGQDALDALDKSKGYVKTQRDSALQNLEASKRASKIKGRGSARGVNTMRALDTSVDIGASKSQRDIYSVFANQMMQLFSQQGTLENQQDAAVMGGEATRDAADRADRDAYYSQMAQDISTKGEGYQQMGKNLNQVKTRNVQAEFMKYLTDYVEGDIMTGKMSQKKNLVLTGNTSTERATDFTSKKGWELLDSPMTKTEWYALTNAQRKAYIDQYKVK